MGTAKTYVATQSFTLALDGKRAVSVNPGDQISFDGVTAEVGGDKGEAKLLSKVIGEWIDVPSKAKISAKTQVVRTRNRTGGQIVEGSDPVEEIRQQGSPRGEQPASNDYELAGLVTKYENESQKTIKVSSEDDLRKEASQQRRIMNADEDIVATVSEPAKAGSNTSGVQIDKQSEKRAVLSEDQRVAKETTYPDVKKLESSEVQKKLPVEKEGQGVVVKKTTTAKAPTTKAAKGVIHQERVVKNVDAKTPKHTDVGSSTQVTTRAAVQEMGPSDGVIVGKVRPTSETKVIEGMTVKATTGASGEMSAGEVEFSDGDAQMQEPGVIYANGGDTPVDLSSISDDDLDVTALLNTGDNE